MLFRSVPVPFDAGVAMDAAGFDTMQADPFDRLIVAAAANSKARLVTADSRTIAFAKSVGLPLVEL